MKKVSLTTLILIAGFSAGTVLFAGCGNNKKGEGQEQTEDENHEHKEGEEQKGDDEATAYACPMHPEVTGKKGDTCSKCGMKLEPVKDADSTKVDAEHEH